MAPQQQVPGIVPGLEYEIVEEVDAGGSGVVYRATLSDGRPAAVKRLHNDAADDALLREARTLAGLSHRNIVKFYGVRDNTDHSLDLVMEWVGPSLARLKAHAPTQGPMGPSLALHIIRELLQALAYLHSVGKVHRDVTPRNMLLATDGTVKLVDFGLTRAIAAPRTTAVLRGTPRYASPEHLLSHALIDARSDLFAVGVILYELITGTVPYRSTLALENGEPYTPITALRPEVPAEFDALVACLLQFDREQRPQSAEAALAALPSAAMVQPAVARADLLAWMRQSEAHAEKSTREPAAGVPYNADARAGATPAADAQPTSAPSSPLRRLGLAAAALLTLGTLLGAGAVYALTARDDRAVPTGTSIEHHAAESDSGLPLEAAAQAPAEHQDASRPASPGHPAAAATTSGVTENDLAPALPDQAASSTGSRDSTADPTSLTRRRSAAENPATPNRATSKSRYPRVQSEPEQSFTSEVTDTSELTKNDTNRAIYAPSTTGRSVQLEPRTGNKSP